MLIFSILLGCLLGFTFAYMITAILVSKSNNHGDSKGNFYTFSKGPLHMRQERNNIKRPY